ncbi:MAG: hypothetical protein JXR94_17345, partial [Candidatus Hydrogenedentes bacterium]|nr:hypothetical protein [Candidatus Hydrogenedentota bacterium]
IRNELGMSIYQLDRPMADHDLGFAGFGDYWRRCVRTGATYAEIAARCRRSADPMWQRECVNNVAWAAAYLVAVVLLVVGCAWIRWAVAAAAGLVLVRKAIQTARRGHAIAVASVYALHTYFAKLPLAFGEFRWLLAQARRKR